MARRKKAAKPAPLSDKIMYAALAIGILIGLNVLFAYIALAANGFNPSSASANNEIEILSSLAFPFTALIYLAVVKRMSLKDMVKQLGLSRKGLNWTSLMYGLALFLALFILEFGIGLFQQATGISLPTNVGRLLCGAPTYLLVFTSIGAPIDEEIFFRGFMVPRLGIVISALIFGFLHFISYNSISEFIAAFVFGLLAGYVYKKLNSIYPTIFAHAGVNILAVVGLAAAGGFCQL